MKLLKDENLDIMFYDSSEWAGEQLRFSWITGGYLYKAFHGIEEVKGCLGWEQALKFLISIQPGKKINSIQFWGHGSPGTVWINGEALNMRSLLASSRHRQLLLQLKERLSPETTIWFRSCNVAAGPEGQMFVKSLSQLLGCKVAAHTFVVHVLQGGLHTVNPGQEPDWPLDEGIEVGKDGNLKILWTKPWSPNTLTCLTSKIPEGW